MAKRKNERRPLRLEWIEAGSLADNPANWRRHPEGQTAALKTMLDDVGWAGALLYNEQTKRLIDGHARKDAVPPGTVVPVLVGRWDEDAERRILATLDPLAAMATPDGDALESLLAEVDLQDGALEDLVGLLDAMADDADRYEGPPAAEDDEDGEPAEPRHRGQRVMRFVCGAYTFEVPRQAYDAWLTAIEAKVSADPDRVIAELKRRLQLQPPNKGSSARRGR
ncbi:MAG: hypothetical protein GX591_14325 [Planctomycetes bacterium]|nr:hypothetical protein [Planctomycetota bacterium]